MDSPFFHATQSPNFEMNQLDGISRLLSGIKPDGHLSPEAEGQLIRLESAIQDLLLSSIAAGGNKGVQSGTMDKEKAVTSQLWMLCCRLWVREMDDATIETCRFML